MELPNSSFDPEYFSVLFNAENRHFWFRSRNWIIRDCYGRLQKLLPSGARIVEIGCGNGNVLQTIESIIDHEQLIGMELFFEGLKNARRRVSCDLIVGDIQKPPFSTGLDVIGLFDVIEHIAEDQSILENVNRALTNDGWLLISVPALPCLWSYFDIAAHHVRRYNRESLARLITNAGFTITYMSYTMMTLVPLVWINRILFQKQAEHPISMRYQDERVKEELGVHPIVNGVLLGLLWMETRLLRLGVRLPLGTSLVVVARKHA